MEKTYIEPSPKGKTFILAMTPKENLLFYKDNVPDIKDTVYDDLVLRIVTQQFAPGELLNEKELMQHYGIGKTPLREVLLILQKNGLIRRFPRLGTIVSTIDLNDLREAAEIRVALEDVLCEMVIDRITEPELKALEELTKKLRQVSTQGITTQFITMECQLHLLLYQASKNTKMTKMLHEQQHVFARMWHSFERSQGDLESQLRDWEKVCAAIRTKDKKELKKVYSNHFKSYYDVLKGVFNSEYTPANL